MRLSRSAFALVAAAAACSLADYDVAETFTPSADPYVRMSNDPDAGATPLSVAVVPGPALHEAVTVSLSGADGVVCPPIKIDPADASTWTGALMLTAAADAGVQPMLWDASVHFQSPGFAADLPVTIREGSAIAIVTPGSCGTGGPPIVATTCHVPVPPDAKNGLIVWAIAGGGGGGAGTNQNKCTNTAKGGNGGAGGYVVAQISATPGGDLLVVAGAGGHEGQLVNAGDNFGSGGGGGGVSGVFDGVDAAPIILAGGGGGGGGGACISSAPIDGNNGGRGSGGAGTTGAGSSGGGGGSATSPGANGNVCDTITLRNAAYLLGGGCDPSDAGFVCASGGAPGGGGGYAVGQSISGGGGGGAGLFGGGAGGSQCNTTPSSGGGGGSGYASALVLVTDAGVPLAVGSVDSGPGVGGLGGAKMPSPGVDGYVFVFLR